MKLQKCFITLTILLGLSLFSPWKPVFAQKGNKGKYLNPFYWVGKANDTFWSQLFDKEELVRSLNGQSPADPSATFKGHTSLPQENGRKKKKSREADDSESESTTTAHQEKASQLRINTNIRFQDIAGIEHLVEQIREVVDYLKNASKYKNLGAKVPTGILMVGPPGVGKTMMAQALANECGCFFIYMSGSEFVEMYVGVGASRVRELFATARKHRPCIIFIDEIDAVGAKRSNRIEGGNREYDQTMNQLLVELQGFEKEDESLAPVVVIAATNRADMLDPALMRPGRLTLVLQFNLPDSESRKKILQLYIDKLPMVDKETIDMKLLIDKTEGFNSSELANLVNCAALWACRESAVMIVGKHFELGLKDALNRHYTLR